MSEFISIYCVGCGDRSPAQETPTPLCPHCAVLPRMESYLERLRSAWSTGEGSTRDELTALRSLVSGALADAERRKYENEATSLRAGLDGWRDMAHRSEERAAVCEDLRLIVHAVSGVLNELAPDATGSLAERVRGAFALVSAEAAAALEALEQIAAWDPPGSDSAANWLSAVTRRGLSARGAGAEFLKARRALERRADKMEQALRRLAYLVGIGCSTHQTIGAKTDCDACAAKSAGSSLFMLAKEGLGS